jgi:hypothetical protein
MFPGLPAAHAAADRRPDDRAEQEARSSGGSASAQPEAARAPLMNDDDSLEELGVLAGRELGAYCRSRVWSSSCRQKAGGQGVVSPGETAGRRGVKMLSAAAAAATRVPSIIPLLHPPSLLCCPCLCISHDVSSSISTGRRRRLKYSSCSLRSGLDWARPPGSFWRLAVDFGFDPDPPDPPSRS